MFEMIPGMSFWQRFSLWWSCVWRQMVYAIPVYIGLLILFGVSVLTWRMRYSGGGHPPVVLLVLGGLLLIVGMMVLSILIVGYAVNHGFKAHRLTVPDAFDLGRAWMLGLTTLGWSTLVSFAANLCGVLPIVLRLVFGPSVAVNLLVQLVVLCLVVVGTMYFVLPRQAWRLRKQAGM